MNLLPSPASTSKRDERICNGARQWVKKSLWRPPSATPIFPTSPLRTPPSGVEPHPCGPRRKGSRAGARDTILFDQALPGDRKPDRCLFRTHAEGRGAYSLINCWRAVCACTIFDTRQSAKPSCQVRICPLWESCSGTGVTARQRATRTWPMRTSSKQRRRWGASLPKRLKSATLVSVEGWPRERDISLNDGTE